MSSARPTTSPAASPGSPIRPKSGRWPRRPRSRWSRPPSRRPSPPRRRSPALRQDEAALRAPLQEAKAELARIETEARTLAKILNAATGDLFPAVLEQIKVERGYETALGAALGEDLDVPLDRSAPAHWGGSEPQPGDPALPQEASCRWPSVVAGAAAAGAPPCADRHRRRRPTAERLQALLAPGQRLVSRDGALWRWDGLVASADAPTAAAQRLAQKNRLAELDAEAVAATARLRAAEQALADAERALREGTRSRARCAPRLARRAARARRGARRAAEGREGGRRTAGRAAPRSPNRCRGSTRRMPRRPPPSPRPSAGSPRRPTLSELQAAFDRLAADVAARPRDAGRRARRAMTG